MPNNRANYPHPLSYHLARIAASGQLENLDGIRAYQKHDYIPAPSALDVMWEDDCIALKALTDRPDGMPIICIPSLINGAEIFHLNEDHSLLEILQEKTQRPVILLHWRHTLTMPNLNALMRHLNAAIDTPCDVIGYCMGGTLAVMAAHKNKSIQKLILLATPWNFQATTPIFQNYNPAINVAGYETWLQALFSAIEPESYYSKFARFAALDPDSENAHIFIAVEDWLNSMQALPVTLAQDIYQNWFIQNAPMHDHTDVCLGNPVFIMTAKNDRLVPPASTHALYDLFRKLERCSYDTGHIGLMAGHKSRSIIWNDICDFLL